MGIYFESQLIICTLKLQYREIMSPWIALGWINTIFTVLPHGYKRCMVRRKGRTNLCKRLWRGEKIAGHKLLLPQSLWSSPSGCPLTWEERVTTERIQGLFLTKQFPCTLHGSREQCPYITWQERHFNPVTLEILIFVIHRTYLNLHLPSPLSRSLLAPGGRAGLGQPAAGHAEEVAEGCSYLP